MSTVDRVIELMKNTFGVDFNTYYDGDPLDIPRFNLPAIIVEQTGDETVEAAYGQDDVTDQFIVKVVLDKSDDFDGDLVNPLDLTAKKIRDFIGHIDPETGTYATKTVKYALRTHLTDGETALAPQMSVKYGVTQRKPQEGYADITAEGHVNFSILYSRNTDALG